MAAALGGEESPVTLAWSGQAVDVATIEAALADLRREAAGVEDRGDGPFAIRTSVLNLVVYAADAQAARRAADTIASLSEQHPSRSIILIAEPTDAASRIDAQLSAHCHLAGPERQVCCEEVTLTVRGGAARHLHSIVLPLLAPDLPVFFWWTGDLPPDPHLIEELVDSADRFVVDSARFLSPSGSLSRLAGLCAAHPACAVGDFNWARLSSWRGLTAQLFDAPPFAPYLEALSQVEVEYALAGASSANPSQALLLVGWLAAGLGWQPQGRSPGQEVWHLQAQQGPVTVRLVGKSSPEVEAGSLSSVRLSAPGAEFFVRRTGDPQVVITAARAPGAELERTARIESCLDPQLLSEELGISGRDSSFEQALTAVMALLASPSG